MNGLTKKEAGSRLQKYGPNRLEAVNDNPWWKMLFRQFTDLMVIILIVSAGIAVGTGLLHGDQEGLFDGLIILGIVLLNAGIGFFQEFKTEKTLEALRKLISPQAIVIRDGEKIQIDAETIVPGDLVVLNAGDKIPADGILVETSEVKADEAPLTGESVPVHKKLKDELFMGTTIVAGTGIMEVQKTGMETQFGRIAHLTTKTVQDQSPLQKEMFHIGLFVTKVTIVLSGILILAGMFLQEKPFLESLLFAVSVAVAAVPEGLPATITVALALGVQRMAKRQMVVKRLSSVETLGSTTVICSDKTGTLTKNEMTVTKILLGTDEILEVTGTGYSPHVGEILSSKSETQNKSQNLNSDLQKLRFIANYCSEAQLQKKNGRYVVLGDPTEGALLTLAEKKVGKKTIPIPEIKITDKIPFDSTRKMMSVIVGKGSKGLKGEKGEEMELLTKGSPDELLKRCTHILKGGKTEKFTAEMKKKVQKANEEMASEALRVIGFAYKELSKSDLKKDHHELEHGLVYLGLAGMIDPPREEVFHAVESCHRAGIRTIVVTGDHGLTAKAIAIQIGLANENTPVITGAELEEMTDKELEKILQKNMPVQTRLIASVQGTSLIFSRVNPEHKRRIVDRLKRMGEIVAVTGDGVNDAPALKRADLGIAMGITGTEVSKETANMILLDDSFASIVSAVEEGRKIYENLKKFTWFIFSTNIGELVVVFTAIFFQLPTPLSAVLILAINVGTDIFPAIALGIDHGEPGVMSKAPRSPKLRIMNRSFVSHFVWMGFFIGVLVIALFIWKLQSLGWEYGQRLDAVDPTLISASSFAFAAIVVYQLYNAFNARSTTHSVFGLRPLWQLWGASVISMGIVLSLLYIPVLQELFHTTGLSWSDWGVIFVSGLSILVVEEVRKLLQTSKKPSFGGLSIK
ncbi:MAG: cation-translocating P-type ATPase [Candidatus Altimarinota bacterium]